MSDSKLDRKPGFLNIVLTTIAAAFGVQSNKNRERDFKHGSITTYIIAGLIFTASFVLIVFMIVKVVLSQVGA